MNDSEQAYRDYLQRKVLEEQRRVARMGTGVRQKLAQRRRNARGPYAHLKGHAWFAGNGHLGGMARAKNLTPERRSEIARLAAQARWSRWAPPPKTERR